MKIRHTTFLSLLLLVPVFCARAQWARDAKSQAFSRSNGVATDNSGNVFTTGVFVCVTAFGTDSLFNNSCGEVSLPAPANPQTDGFLAKHDPDGTLQWVLQFSGSPGNKLFVNDVAVDDDGNAYVAGAFTGTLDLIASTFNNPDATTEYFVVKVDPDGNAEWALSNSVDDLSEMSAQKVAASGNGVYITGLVRDDFQFDAFQDSVGRDASFVTAFDPSGTHLWTHHFMEFNSDGSSRGKALEAVGDSIWVFSSFTDTVNIDGLIVPPPGPNGSITAGIICLYNAAGTLLHHTVTNTPLIEGIRLFRPDMSLYITGRAENTTGIGEDTLFLGAGVRAYVSKHTLDAAANLEWVVHLTAASSTGLTGLSIDVSPSGEVYAGGIFNGANLNGPNTTAPGGGAQNGFVVKLDASGIDEWLQSFGGAGDDAMSALAASAANLYGAGYFARYLRVAGDELNSNAASNGFVARIDLCPQLIADMLSPDTTFVCMRDTATFQATDDPAYTYQWYHDGTPVAGAESPDLDVTEEGTYRVEISGVGCTKLTPIAKLMVNPLPDSVVLTNDPMDNCIGDAVVLTGPLGSYDFQWLNNGVPMPDISRELTVTADGDYRLRVTDPLGCAILSDTFAVRFYAYPSPILSPPGGRYALCSGNTLTLEADNSQPGMTWQWRKDDIPITDADEFQFGATASGIYHAVVSNAIGCTTTTEADTVVIQASPVVDLNDETLPPQICSGNTLRLVTQNVIGQSYQWFRDGNSIPTASDNILDVNTGGAYSVRVNNALCEKFSETFELTVHPLPDAIIVNNAPATLCEGDPFALQAQEATGYSYEWLADGQILSAENNATINIIKTGNYALRVTNQFSCQDTSPATTVIVNRKPPASITAEGDLIFCEGGNVHLTANAGTLLQYEWIKDGTLMNGYTQRTVEIAQSGEFKVRVTNSNLCSATSLPVQVNVVGYPVSTIASASGSTSMCERDSLQLTANTSGAFTYAWLLNEHPLEGATAAILHAKTPGSYRVVASAGSCADTSHVLSLQVRANPVPVVTRNEAFLSIAEFGVIQWYRDDTPLAGATLQAIRVTADGSYTVNVVNSEGCSAWSEAISVCLPLAEIRKTNDVLAVSIAAAEYRWEYGGLPVSGAFQRQLKAQQSGVYSAVVISDDGCVMETEPVTVCIPYPQITQDTFTGILYAFPNPATSYRWYYNGLQVAGGNTQVHIPDLPGNYTVQVNDLEGCISFSEPFSIDAVTGIEPESHDLRFYPNPATDIVTVERPGNDVIFAVIVDALGRKVLEVSLKDTVEQIDLSSLAPGTYLVLGTAPAGNVFGKLIKR